MRLLNGCGSSGRWIGLFDKGTKSGVSFEEISPSSLSELASSECPLPPLSALLENARIRETDSLVICVQIHCPYGPSFPQQPSVYSVPRDLLEGLEASLDNPSEDSVNLFVPLIAISHRHRGCALCMP